MGNNTQPNWDFKIELRARTAQAQMRLTQCRPLYYFGIEGCYQRRTWGFPADEGCHTSQYGQTAINDHWSFCQLTTSEPDGIIMQINDRQSVNRRIFY